MLLCFSCSEGEDSRALTNTTALETSDYKPKKEGADTIFIHRVATNDYYHAIYIDTTHNSKAYARLTNFDFNSNDSQTYMSYYAYYKEQYPDAYKKISPNPLPENWLPVYLYKDQYYLYAPSDWGNAGRRIINDTAYVEWQMDGPYPQPISSFITKSEGHYTLETLNPFKEVPEIQILEIQQIDSQSGLSLFTFPDGSDDFKHNHFVPLQGAKYFDLVVNHCSTQKQLEFEFDKIDRDKVFETQRNK